MKKFAPKFGISIRQFLSLAMIELVSAAVITMFLLLGLQDGNLTATKITHSPCAWGFITFGIIFSQIALGGLGETKIIHTNWKIILLGTLLCTGFMIISVLYFNLV